MEKTIKVQVLMDIEIMKLSVLETSTGNINYCLKKPYRIEKVNGHHQKQQHMDIKDDLLNNHLMMTMNNSHRGKSPANSLTTGNGMHATFSTQTGLAPQNGTYLAMINAKMERDQKKL